jgi:integrase
MASIGSDPNGRKRILFVAGDGRRMTVRLGKMSAKQADAFKVKVEDLIGAANGAGMVHDETSRWLSGLDDKMHARLVAVGLAKPRNGGGSALLGPFIDGFTKALPHPKRFTLTNWAQVRRWLVDFFGETKDMRTVTPADAEDWAVSMRDGKLGENTIRRHTGRARQLWKAAIRRAVVRGANPFEGMAITVRADKARQFFVTREAATKVLDACPDAQWRLLFALSRYGGLRCPSEHLALKWSDVDWDKNRVRVPSPKTEHHEGKDCRYIPLFPELRPYLLEVFEQAEPGTDYVISRYRDGYGNLRTQLGRIIRKAGLTVWAKPWHNLRATRQTELCERYPLHVVCAWIGNSAAVANEHYLQVTDAHFAAAVGAAQNPAQTPADTSGQQPTAGGAAGDESHDCQAVSAAVTSGPSRPVPPVGFEPTLEGF